MARFSNIEHPIEGKAPTGPFAPLDQPGRSARRLDNPENETNEILKVEN